ncbi:MAG: hypothetical protein EKK41_12750 [Hyphomicrobiales bacterium]|nr:MAG: hypothetical protein EKK41_12750 [Hyphomicrobiales bacterium]
MVGNSDLPRSDLPDKELALWMLKRMRDSVGFMEVLRKARVQGKRDVLDTPAYVARHSKRIARLYQSSTEEDIAAASSTAAAIEEIMRRDLISSPEEFLEKAIVAYIEKHGANGLLSEWQSTFEAAEAEIEGRTRGAFEAGLVERLAGAAREEMARQADHRLKGRGQEGREG